MEPQPAKATTRPLESYLPGIDSLLRQILKHAGFDVTFAIRQSKPEVGEVEAPEVVVDFSGPDADLFLERKAHLLNALEYVVLKAVRLEEDLFGKITFDSQDWRRLRAQELKLTAQVAAERVVETGDPLTLTPMSPRERRIVHMALKDHPQVRTVSEGVGPDRKVVILPVSSSAPHP